MTAKQKRVAAPVALPADDDEGAPIEVLRLRLTRRLYQLVSDHKQRWRGCRVPACKRARACRAPQDVCANAMPDRKPVEER